MLPKTSQNPGHPNSQARSQDTRMLGPGAPGPSAEAPVLQATTPGLGAGAPRLCPLAPKHKFSGQLTSRVHPGLECAGVSDLRCALPVRKTDCRPALDSHRFRHESLYHRFLSIAVSIDWQRPEITVETNPVRWKIQLGSLRGGFCDLFGTFCERTPGFGLASPVCLASNLGV